MKRLFFILLALFSVTAILADKTQSSIKQEKQQANKEIKETKRKIESNKKATKAIFNPQKQRSRHSKPAFFVVKSAL